MERIIENSKRVIKETSASTLSRLELEKKKIELEARSQLFGTIFGVTNHRDYCSA